MKNALRWLLLALPWLLPAYLLRFKLGPVPTTVLEIAVLALLAVFTALYGLKGWQEGWEKLKGFRYPLVAFGVASLAAALWSPVVVQGLGLWRAYVLEPALLLFVFAVSIGREVKREDLDVSIFGSVIALAIWGVIEFVLTGGQRVDGPYPYFNALALAVVPFGAYGLTRFIQSRTWLGLGAFGAALMASLVAKSDGGLIALLAVLWFGLIAQKKLRWFVVGMTIVGMVVGLSVPQIREPVLKELRLENWSGYVRKKMWQDTWAMLKDHPIKGAGMAGYPTVFKPYQTTTGIEVFQYPHTIIFNFWAETGLLGLIAFAWLVIEWLRKRGALLLPLVAILIHGLVDVPYFKNDLAIAFYLLLALCVFSSAKNLNKDMVY
jgi:O-antigen ligase